MTKDEVLSAVNAFGGFVCSTKNYLETSIWRSFNFKLYASISKDAKLL